VVTLCNASRSLHVSFYSHSHDQTFLHCLLPLTSPNVLTLRCSGCKDEQTSGDVGNVGAFGLPADVGPGGAGGACTNAMMATFYKSNIYFWKHRPAPTYLVRPSCERRRKRCIYTHVCTDCVWKRSDDDTPDIPECDMTWAQVCYRVWIALQKYATTLSRSPTPLNVRACAHIHTQINSLFLSISLTPSLSLALPPSLSLSLALSLSLSLSPSLSLSVSLALSPPSLPLPLLLPLLLALYPPISDSLALLLAHSWARKHVLYVCVCLSVMTHSCHTCATQINPFFLTHKHTHTNTQIVSCSSKCAPVSKKKSLARYES